MGCEGLRQVVKTALHQKNKKKKTKKIWAETFIGKAPCTRISGGASTRVWWYCAIHDKNMKLGTLLETALRKIFGYRTIADFSYSTNEHHFE